MNAIAQIHAKTLSALRGAYIRDLIEDYGLTGNTVADRAGITRSTFASRLRGDTALLADEIERIAKPLRLAPTELFSAYLSVTPENPGGNRSLFINVGPAGIEPTTSTVVSGRFGEDHLASVTSITEAPSAQSAHGETTRADLRSVEIASQG